MIKALFSTKHSKFVLLCFIPVTITSVAVQLMNNNGTDKWLRMIWNFFLAAIPVYMALLASNYYKEGKRGFTALFSVLWLLFFPNTMYMLTDFKYLSYFDFDYWAVYDIVDYNAAPWVLLINLVICVTAGVLCGTMSMELMADIVSDKLSKKAVIPFLTVVSALSSFGIYIGRFARLNSWDILLPQKLFDDTMMVMTPFAPLYIFIFTVMTMFLYGAYYFIKRILK